MTKTDRKQNENLFHPLFLGAIAGNKPLYQQLLNNISQLAQHFVQKKTGNHADIDDIVQEILLSVHRSLHTYDPTKPCMPWLAAIMHYRLSDWMRKQYRTDEQHKLSYDELENFLGEYVTELPLENEYIHKAVASLPEKQQQVIQAMYFKEMTVKEASADLSMSISAVKVTAHRAYKKLALLLGEEQ